MPAVPGITAPETVSSTGREAGHATASALCPGRRCCPQRDFHPGRDGGRRARRAPWCRPNPSNRAPAGCTRPGPGQADTTAASLFRRGSPRHGLAAPRQQTGRQVRLWLPARLCVLGWTGDSFTPAQAGAAFALARAARFFGDEPSLAVSRQAMLTLLLETTTDPQDKGRPSHGRTAAAGQPACQPGAAGAGDL